MHIANSRNAHDVIVVVTRRHFGGIRSVKNDGVKNAEIWRFLMPSFSCIAILERCIIPHTTVCKHTQVYDVTLLT